MTRPVTVGVSLKAYFGLRRASEYATAVAELARAHPAVTSGAVELFLIPSYLAIPAGLAAVADAGAVVAIGAQDVSAEEPGPFTGEVTASELAEAGVAVVEVGHAERRRLYGETDAVVAAKTAAALRHGLVPVLCIGEPERAAIDLAAQFVLAQLAAALEDAPAGRVVVAYEPVWAIGAAEPADPAHVVAVIRALRAELDARTDRPGSSVIYGGSAGPGLLAQLAGAADGLFLGRFAHDPAALGAVIDEAAAVAADRAGVGS